MNSKDIINNLNIIILDQDVSFASVARRMNKTGQALGKQLSNDDMKLSTMFAILNAIHCDIDITITDRATGKVYKP